MKRAEPSILVLSQAPLVQQVIRAFGADRRFVRIETRTADEILRDPMRPSALVVESQVAGALLAELLRWSERDLEERVPTAVFGHSTDDVAFSFGREHVRWFTADPPEEELASWLRVAVEVHDLRNYRSIHESIARQINAERARLRTGEDERYAPPSDPPCGPPLPTNLDEIQSLRDARTLFERGLIRAAVREYGSLKDASTALRISYTSLWRRMRGTP